MRMDTFKIVRYSYTTLKGPFAGDKGKIYFGTNSTGNGGDGGFSHFSRTVSLLELSSDLLHKICLDFIAVNPFNC